jgi:periplasmic copper chaperone A
MMRLCLIAAAYAAGLAFAAAAEPSAITVTDAWARATPPGAKTGAAYVTVTNTGKEADTLVSASTPVAGAAQLHTTLTENGVMKMRPVSAIELKPGASVTLKPGGMHLMLTGLKQPLKQGESFPLALTFARAGKVDASVSVQKAGAMSGMDMGDMPGTNMK